MGFLSLVELVDPRESLSDELTEVVRGVSAVGLNAVVPDLSQQRQAVSGLPVSSLVCVLQRDHAGPEASE